MLDLWVFRSGPFIGGVVAMLGYAATVQVMVAFLPQYLQRGLGVPFLWTGCSVLPFALSMFLFPTLGRRLSMHLYAHHLLSLGLAIGVAGNLMLALSSSAENPIWFFIGMAVLGAGGGLINGETQKAILSEVPRERAGMASGVGTTARFSGMLVGYAGLSSVMAIGIERGLYAKLCTSPETCSLDRSSVIAVVTGCFSEQNLPLELINSDVALTSYKSGFQALFFVAFVVATIATIVTLLLMSPERARMEYSGVVSQI